MIRRFVITSVFAWLGTQLVFTQNAAAQNASTSPAAPDALTVLCSAGVEGSFQGLIEKTPALFNVICLDGSRVAMGISYGAAGTEIPLTLINSLIDDDGSLVFSISPLDQPDRKSASSGSPNMYARIDVDALKAGILKGTYLGGNSVRPRKLTAKKTVSLPPLSSLVSIGSEPIAARGTYILRLPGVQAMPFWFDIVSGVPVVTIDDGNRGLHLIDGPTWDGKGGFAVTNVFGDFLPQTFANLTQMRGFVGKPGSLEIYYIDPLHGVQGPITAFRQPGD